MDTHSNESQVKNEQVPLIFLKWDPLYGQAKPYQIFTSLPLDVPSTNLTFEDVDDVPIRNIRAYSKSFTLNDHGFQLCNHTSQLTDFNDIEEIEGTYLPEVKQLIQTHVEGSDRIVFFDWRVCVFLILHHLVLLK